MAITVKACRALSKDRGSLLITCAGGAGGATVSNAELLAAFPAGTPLGDLVRTAVANNAAAVAAMTGGDVASSAPTGRIYLSSQQAGTPSAPPTIVPTEAAGVITLVLDADADGTWYFYIENVHSLAR